MSALAWLPSGGIILSSVVAITAVWLAARFAAKQGHRSKVWDRKAEAYSAILEALHEMEEWYSEYLDDEFLARDVGDETKRTRDADYRAARKLLRRSIAREVWLLPSPVQQRLRQMNKALLARHESWFEALDDGLCEVKKAIGDVTDLARADLRPEASKKDRGEPER